MAGSGSRKEADPSFSLWVRVKPRSRRDAVVGREEDGALVIQLKAVPHKGEANRECRRFLARILGVSPSRVLLEKGHGSPRKKFRIVGLSRREGDRRLEKGTAGE